MLLVSGDILPKRYSQKAFCKVFIASRESDRSDTSNPRASASETDPIGP